tara:strand:- start:99 stop:446 length:348 start_codon:yes stop_codon:yes gene_type:complete
MTSLLVPSFQTWVNTAKETPLTNLFSKKDIEFTINSNGVYGVKCVYDFMVIVCQNQLKPETHASLWSIHETFQTWQKDLINDVWTIGMKHNISVNDIMTSETYMGELGYVPLKIE